MTKEQIAALHGAMEPGYGDFFVRIVEERRQLLEALRQLVGPAPLELVPGGHAANSMRRAHAAIAFAETPAS